MVKKQILLSLVALYSPGLWVQAEKGNQEPGLNLGFEETSEMGKPAAWYLGGKGYEIVSDRDVVHSGTTSLRLESKPGEREFAVVKGDFPIALASGKKITLHGWFKTEDVEDGRIGLWWRVDGKEDGKRQILAFDNMLNNPVSGTQDWKEYAIEIDVPTGGVQIKFGILFTGTGTAWADDLRVTFAPGSGRKTGKLDLNLDFEEFSTMAKPATWVAGGKGYRVFTDKEVVHSGKASLRFESTSVTREFAVARGNFPVSKASGKKLNFHGWLKTKDVEDGRIGLWWRVDGMEDGNERILAFDNMFKNPVSGTTDWQEYSIEIDIPVGGTNINFGVFFSGTGTAWADGLRIVLDGEPYRP